MTRRSLRTAALAVAAGFALSGCTLDITEWRVPGGAASGDAYELSAVFADVQNLIPQAQVRYQNVAIGDVVDIALRPDDMAVATLRIAEGVAVPGNAVAELNTTSLLGEMYVDLRVPDGELPQGPLAPGATLDEGRTNLVPQFEQALAALSTVLNGSGLSQIQTIVREVNTAFAGRVPETRDLIEQLTEVVGTVEANKTAITDLLDRLDRLTATLAADRETIDVALTELAPGVQAVNASLDGITQLSTRVAALGDTAERVLGEITDETVADLEKLRPIVHTLADVRGDLATAVHKLAAVEPLIQRAVPGDHVNISGQATLAVGGLIQLMEQMRGGTLSPAGSTAAGRAVPSTTPAGPGVGGLAAVLETVRNGGSR